MKVGDIAFGLVTGFLPDVEHHFSTIIYHDGIHYELNGKFHGWYPSKSLYKQWWKLVRKKFQPAPAAIESRVRAVLRRAKVKVVAFKYMTTASLKSGAMRHVSAVQISSSDFSRLNSQGMLRQLHDDKHFSSVEEKTRLVIYGLIPIAAQLTKAVA